jgi:HlyD family secretion protein
LFAGGLVIAIAVWAFTATISGAVIAGGSLTVLSDIKKIQPPTAGVITKINVQNGQRVKAGEALIVLDDTVAKANLSVAETSLIELEARQARLIAERDGRSSITFDTPSFESLTPDTIKDIQANEIRLFNLRRNTYDGCTAGRCQCGTAELHCPRARQRKGSLEKTAGHPGAREQPRKRSRPPRW